MAKPRIFISSTYYDLKHVRSSLESFVNDMGYESILFESGDIYFDPTKPLDESCYKEVESCHMLVLIIGGKYGSPESAATKDKKTKPDDLSKQYEFYNSITKNEYLSAMRNNKPVMIFVDNGVYSEYQTYKKNRDNKSIKYAHVDNISIFYLLDDIMDNTNAFIKTFEGIKDITHWLRVQWAAMFCDYLMNKSEQIKLAGLSEQLTSLADISKTLKSYSENLLMSNENIKGQDIINEANKSLEKKTYERFLADDLIEHILEYPNLPVSPEELFEIFKEADNFNDFITKAKFEEEFLTNHFHEDGRIRADAVYASLRRALL